MPAGSHPHDVAPAPDGTVWYTAQNVGKMGRLDPATGEIVEVTLPSPGSAPHGVIVGPDGAAWVTDQGANTIERVDPDTFEVTTYPMPDGRISGPAHADLRHRRHPLVHRPGTRDRSAVSIHATGEIDLFDAPRRAGPVRHRRDSGRRGLVRDRWRESYLAQIDREIGDSTVYEPPTPDQGARRVWSDSTGRLWVSEWNAGQLARYDPATEEWREWPLPGDAPQAYAVYVDELDYVWVTDFGSNSIVRFDPATETFDPYPLPTAGRSGAPAARPRRGAVGRRIGRRQDRRPQTGPVKGES